MNKVYFIVDRETRAIMFEVDSIEEGLTKINQMIEEDHDLGFFAENLYDLVDGNRISWIA